LSLPPLPPMVPLATTAKAIKVRNLSNKRFHEFWVPNERGKAPVYQGVIEPNSETTTNSYLTHTFRFCDLQDKKKIVFEFSVRPEQEVYAYVEESTADPIKLKSHREELEFAREYKKRHNGRPWLGFYPHEPAKTFMWPADYIGQEHFVQSRNGPGEQPMNFTLRVVSVRPRAYVIDYFVSEQEANYVVDHAKEKLARSSVEMRGPNGERIDTDTRTSKNAWLGRGEKGTVTDLLYRRTADLLNVNEKTLHNDHPDGVAESMQVVHYKNGALYAPHHDWGVRDGPHTRFATVLLYLNDVAEGGETTFPKALVGKPEGLAVKPKRGQAVLFYSQFPDGNVDDESLHEARPVYGSEEKWLANVWVHDKVYWMRER
jgi:prolyl 4-hydroxylase